MLCCSVFDLNFFLCSGLPAERDGPPVDSHIRSLGDLGGAGENCASCILEPPLNQHPADGPYEQRPVGFSFSNVADGPFIVHYLLLVVSLLTRVFEDGSCLGEQDMAHAAASVHATLMSEEDAQSEGETNLSSMRGNVQRSAPARAGHAHGHTRRPQHHSAGMS